MIKPLLILRRVVGDSMMPTLKHGDIVLASSIGIRSGSIVVAHIDGRDVIKRLQVNGSQYSLYGDNTQSTTNYVNIDRHTVMARVILPIKPKKSSVLSII